MHEWRTRVWFICRRLLGRSGDGAHFQNSRRWKTLPSQRSSNVGGMFLFRPETRRSRDEGREKHNTVVYIIPCVFAAAVRSVFFGPVCDSTDVCTNAGKYWVSLCLMHVVLNLRARKALGLASRVILGYTLKKGITCSERGVSQDEPCRRSDRGSRQEVGLFACGGDKTCTAFLAHNTAKIGTKPLVFTTDFCDSNILVVRLCPALWCLHGTGLWRPNGFVGIGTFPFEELRKGPTKIEN